MSLSVTGDFFLVLPVHGWRIGAECVELNLVVGLASVDLMVDNSQMLMLQAIPQLITFAPHAAVLVLKTSDPTAQGSSGSSSSPWISVAGAVGAVLGACIAGSIGFASSWYALRRQGLQAFNERFATAAKELGDAEAATRLAGVYAMAGLADDWKRQRQACIDVLCGYMRLPYEPTPGEPGFKLGEREVRLAILRNVRDHLRKDARSSWQGVHLQVSSSSNRRG